MAASFMYQLPEQVASLPSEYIRMLCISKESPLIYSVVVVLHDLRFKSISRTPLNTITMYNQP